jgi:hypothetical protein
MALLFGNEKEIIKQFAIACKQLGYVVKPMKHGLMLYPTAKAHYGEYGPIKELTRFFNKLGVDFDTQASGDERYYDITVGGIELETAVSWEGIHIFPS